ncbi:MAG: type II toxin-antitoxin system VapC family toxin [Chthoniobacteraceae bacterium]
MSIYADTNYLTRLYLEQSESATADKWFASEQPILPVTWLVRVELINAFEQAVFSGFGEREARIAPELAAACQVDFREDLREGRAVRLVDVSMHELTRHFEEIALRHTARHGFRTYDILHVASALTLGRDTFWSFDKRAVKLAKLEGLRTI